MPEVCTQAYQSSVHRRASVSREKSLVWSFDLHPTQGFLVIGMGSEWDWSEGNE